METNHTNYPSDRDDQDAGYQNPENHAEFENLTQGESSGEFKQEECHEKRHFPKHYGIGRYRSFSNHSSASDQPHTNTGW